MDLQGRTELFGYEDIDSNDGWYEGKILVICPHHVREGFKADYQKPEFQLVKGTGGFGCSPVTLGSAVFVKFLEDGESARYDRNQIAGVLKQELIDKYGLAAAVNE